MGRESLRQEVVTLLSSSFWQNFALSQLLWQFYCEILKEKRQFLTVRHIVKYYFKTQKDQEEVKQEDFRRAQRCWRISCLLTLSSRLPGQTVCCRYQVPSTPPTDKSRRVRSYIWTRTNSEESCPKPSVAPAWCFPVIPTANGRKMWWSSARTVCLLNCYCSFKLCLSYTTPYFTCQNGGGIWLARGSLSNKGTVDWISGQQKATLGTMTRYSLSDGVD